MATKKPPKKNHLQVVGADGSQGPNFADIQTLDLDKLRESMVRGIYTLEAALFTQSGFEYQRIEKLRSVIGEFEKTLLDPAYIKGLTDKNKIKLYGLMLHNMNTSLNFLQGLHGSITSGVDALTQIEKLKSQRGVSSTDPNLNTDKLDQVKKIILEKIKEKSTTKK